MIGGVVRSVLAARETVVASSDRGFGLDVVDTDVVREGATSGEDLVGTPEFHEGTRRGRDDGAGAVLEARSAGRVSAFCQAEVR